MPEPIWIFYSLTPCRPVQWEKQTLGSVDSAGKKLYWRVGFMADPETPIKIWVQMNICVTSSNPLSFWAGISSLLKHFLSLPLGIAWISDHSSVRTLNFFWITKYKSTFGEITTRCCHSLKSRSRQLTTPRRKWRSAAKRLPPSGWVCVRWQVREAATARKWLAAVGSRGIDQIRP